MVVRHAQWSEESSQHYTDGGYAESSDMLSSPRIQLRMYAAQELVLPHLLFLDPSSRYLRDLKATAEDDRAGNIGNSTTVNYQLLPAGVREVRENPSCENSA